MLKEGRNRCLLFVSKNTLSFDEKNLLTLKSKSQSIVASKQNKFQATNNEVNQKLTSNNDWAM